MSPPWMPLYVGDYLADTAHLRAIEHGAYLLLIMHYWRTEGLPDDDLALARITRLSNADWKRVRPVIAPLFSAGWKHKRIEFELTEAARISAAGKKGGQASGAARRTKSAQRLLNDQPTINERPFNGHGNDPPTNREALQSQLQSQERKQDAAAAPPPQVPSEEADFYRRIKQIAGSGAGGLGKLLLTAKDGNVALARAAVEQASTKQDPREYLGAIIRTREDPACRPDRSF